MPVSAAPVAIGESTTPKYGPTSSQSRSEGCSLTTVIGYSSLLLAENRALFLFGLFAVMGEIACVTTAVVVLPSVLAAWERRRQPKHATP